MQEEISLSKEYFEPAHHVNESDSNVNQGQVALDELTRILEKMGIIAQVFYHETNNAISLEIRGNNLGLVIGKHGQTLEALEFILNVIHRKRYPESKQLVLDAQGYREKKRSVLKKILFSAKDIVLTTSNEVGLDPMSPSDRKTIHLLCKDVMGVTSESRGDGSNRRVILKPEDEFDRENLIVN